MLRVTKHLLNLQFCCCIDKSAACQISRKSMPNIAPRYSSQLAAALAGMNLLLQPPDRTFLERAILCATVQQQVGDHADLGLVADEDHDFVIASRPAARGQIVADPGPGVQVGIDAEIRAERRERLL